MSLVVFVTVGLSLLASKLLLVAGLSHMGRRYLLTCGIAYLVYLALLWVWMKTLGSHRDWMPDSCEIPDLIPDLSSNSISSNGGSDLLEPVAEAASGVDDIVVPLVLGIVIVVIFCSSAWVIYSAPTLFAELIVDAAMVGNLCHRFSPSDRRPWLMSALQHTGVPFCLTALVAWLGGTLLTELFPKAQTIGDVLFR